jgi:phage-related protein
MANFPQLKTGVVAQYPSDRSQQSFTSVYRFIDGLEQRFRTGTVPLKRWTIRFDLLDEGELSAMEIFFLSQAGRFESFSFTDPWDNTVYASCSFDSDTLELNFSDLSRGAASLTVKENR